ncbi:MAG: hypothetical protein Q4A12_08105 [Eubacteriales bacterium]|nr:hypothetical protein [Eubacteriales bacterium]
MRKLNIFTKILMLTLCAIITISMSVLTPKVAAANETPITETEKTETNTYNEKDEDSIALARAIVMDEAKLEAESIIEELQVEAEKEIQKATESTDDYEYVEPSSSSSSSTNTSTGGSYVSGTAGTGGYLLSIDNPDPNYTSYSITLSDADRDLAERIVMGEAGGTGFTGMALVAQALRDAFVKGGYSDIATVIKSHGYYGSTSIKPSQSCKDAVAFIFDQGGAAVQHRILVFYASNYCSSSWHESQEFVCQYGYVRYFDFW